ncbi:MAG: hypothetical protein ACKVPY_15660 [Paracoccaceae bacterium]
MLRTAILAAAFAAALPGASGAATVTTYSSLASYLGAVGPSPIAENFNFNRLNGTAISGITGSSGFGSNRLINVAGGPTGPQVTTIAFRQTLKAFGAAIVNLSAREATDVFLDGVFAFRLTGAANFFGISLDTGFRTISFADATLPRFNTQFAIDNVRVSAVPVPASVGLLVGALALLAGFRRSRRAA